MHNMHRFYMIVKPHVATCENQRVTEVYYPLLSVNYDLQSVWKVIFMPAHLRVLDINQWTKMGK